MGAVYRAVDERSTTEVALKLVRPDLAQEPALVTRFQREGKLATAVHHENVVALLDSGESRVGLYLAFELVSGGSLKARLASGPLPWREVSTIGAAIARGLEAIHAAGLVHRDVKPDNVLFDGSGRPKLADLGLARVVVGQSSQELTRTGELVGTFEYMAPEQADSARGVDRRADLYSLGATLYALLAGRPPFEGNGMALVKKHLFEAPASLRSHGVALPAELDALVLRLLSKTPDERGASAADIARELEALARSEGRAPRRSRAGPLGVLFACGAVALGWVGYRVSQRSAPLGEPPAPSIAPTPSPQSGRPTPGPANEPEWYAALDHTQRPSRLPRGVTVGTKPLEYVNEKDESVLVYVPGGEFWMGSPKQPDNDSETPRHRVSLSPYFLGKFEVTNRQFQTFVAATGHETRAEREKHGYRLIRHPNDVAGDTYEKLEIAGASWRSPRGAEVSTPPFPTAASNPENPVVQIAWEDAAAYCAWAGLRLPTEAEWELAATGNQEKNFYPWGVEHLRSLRPITNVNDASLQRTLPESEPREAPFPDYDDGFPWTAPVRTFEAASSRFPFGAVELGGNVSEWCSDIFDDNYYLKFEDGHVPHDPPGAKEGDYERGLAHVVRGGSFASSPNSCRGRARDYGFSTTTGELFAPSVDDVGFRVALAVGAER
jgi:serine/threonine-protein kinase